MNKTILIGITGGIAAYKAEKLIRLLKKDGNRTRVIMTHSAASMVKLKQFQKASGSTVFTELFEEGFDYKKVLVERKVEHIQLADSASLLVIIPATANIIAKLSHGIADDYLTTTALAVTCPIIICPSMNVNMWNHPTVRSNLEILRKHGYIIVDPGVGMLACGYEGQGRLGEIEFIHEEVIRQLKRTTSLVGRKIIVTAGGTIEPIDDVRHIANNSSGKMGVAIAEECYLRGADVLLLRSVDSVKPRYIIKEKIFSTPGDLLDLVKESVPGSNMIFHAAAVSDFKVKKSTGKLDSKNEITINLTPRAKILDQIKLINQSITLIAFKAEFGLDPKRLVSQAKSRMDECGADFIVANDVSTKGAGFGSDQNEVYVISRNNEVKKIPLSPKSKIAVEIIDSILLI